jgi:hypothetical protein
MLDYASKPFQCTTIPIDRLELKKKFSGLDQSALRLPPAPSTWMNAQFKTEAGLDSPHKRYERRRPPPPSSIHIASPTKKPLVTQPYLRSSALRPFLGERYSREHIAGPQRRYRGLYLARVNQAGKGCDFDFLREDGGI